MRYIDCELKFKKELSNIELHGIERVLDLIDMGEQIEELIGVNADDYGLAYTSSSSYAMYNVTNTVAYNGQQISHFAITENDMLIMVTYDEDKNYYYYEIESSDY
jgi:hypothetical protein